MGIGGGLELWEVGRCNGDGVVSAEERYTLGRYTGCTEMVSKNVSKK